MKLTKRLIIVVLCFTLLLGYCCSATADSYDKYLAPIGKVVYKEVKKKLYFPESFNLRQCYMLSEEEDGAYFYLDYTAENRVGGSTPSHIFIFINVDEEKGTFKYAIYSPDLDSTNNTSLINKAFSFYLNEDAYLKQAVKMNLDAVKLSIGMASVLE